jgi:dipeptidyl-peptidase-3
LLQGVSATALAEYNSTLEEARADLFGLYYIADKKLVELGILPNEEAYKAEYINFIVNGLFTQFVRIELGKTNTEAHMQDRKLIAEWCYENGLKENTGAKKDVIEKVTKDGKTYFVINDYDALRGLFGKLLAEVQRIKSEGDYKAGKELVEKYAVHINPELHKEVKERYASLNLKPYKGFINPTITPVYGKQGEITDYQVIYNNDFLEQHLEYGKKYSYESALAR